MADHLHLLDFSQRLSAAMRDMVEREDELEELARARIVTLYSYGSKGRELAAMLRARGVECEIFDNGAASRQRATADGYHVTPELDPGIPIVVAAGQNQIEILGALTLPAFNLLEALWAFDLPAPFHSARELQAAVLDSVMELHGVYKMLDAASAAVFLNVLEYRVSLDAHRLQRRRPVGEMWRPPVAGLDIRSFCDIGAYDGDSLRATKSVFPGLSRSFTIEPNPDFTAAVDQTARELGLANSHFVGAAWGGATRLDARTLLSGMFVIEEAPAGRIIAETLDTLLAGEAFDFIKMDVEGTEREVIEGGRHAIAAAKCVAIAGYHLPRDLVELPAQLAGFLGGALGETNSNGWRLAFAHYSQVYDDSIFYVWRPGSTIGNG